MCGFLLLVFILLVSSERGITRQLYDEEYYDHNMALMVHTYSTIQDPVGIVVGEYEHQKGLFVSSNAKSKIYFVSLDHGGHTRTMGATTVAGSTFSYDSDGDFDTATFSEPSRMTYDEQCQLLFVMSKKNRIIRVLDFRDHSVKTVRSNQDEAITFARTSLFEENFPSYDIQGVAGDSLYVAATSALYRVVVNGDEPYCDSITTAAALIPYHSLGSYLQMHNYPSNARIVSVLPDSSRSYLYVAISGGKNVILRVPMSSVYSNQYADIHKIVGNEGSSWNGIAATQNPPVAVNGFAYQDSVSVSFPMHLQKDDKSDTLYWTECYPYADSFLLGSLTVRRISLTTGKVDIYAGYDFSHDDESYLVVGTHGGYVNDVVSAAEFRYPISIAYFEDDMRNSRDSHREGEGSVYVADRFNNAIRRVAVVVNTYSPTAVHGDPTSSPSRFPTPRPTISQEPTATYYPTLAPTSVPSLSIAPTSHPSKRPTRRPTMKPTTMEPTSASVWVQDKSILNTLGFGTVHVSVGMYVLSAFIGVLASSFIVLAYTHRHINPHTHLRTSDDIDEYDSHSEYLSKKIKYIGNSCVYYMGACIPGSAFHKSSVEDINSGTHSNRLNARHRISTFFSRINNVWHDAQRMLSFNYVRGSGNENEPTNDTSVQNVLQSVRERSESEQRRNAVNPARSAFAHTSMSPQEYRELTPRDDSAHNDYMLDNNDLDALDDSARSTTPMIVRSLGSLDDGL